MHLKSRSTKRNTLHECSSTHFKIIQVNTVPHGSRITKRGNRRNKLLTTPKTKKCNQAAVPALPFTVTQPTDPDPMIRPRLGMTVVHKIWSQKCTKSTYSKTKNQSWLKCLERTKKRNHDFQFSGEKQALQTTSGIYWWASLDSHATCFNMQHTYDSWVHSKKDSWRFLEAPNEPPLSLLEKELLWHPQPSNVPNYEWNTDRHQRHFRQKLPASGAKQLPLASRLMTLLSISSSSVIATGDTHLYLTGQSWAICIAREFKIKAKTETLKHDTQVFGGRMVGLLGRNWDSRRQCSCLMARARILTHTCFEMICQLRRHVPNPLIGLAKPLPKSAFPRIYVFYSFW